MKIALAQQNYHIGNFEENSRKIIEGIQWAKKQGADLVVFPEAFVSCYPRGLTFGTTVGSRTAQGRAWFRRYWDSSVDVPGPVVDRLEADGMLPAIYFVFSRAGCDRSVRRGRGSAAG